MPETRVGYIEPVEVASALALNWSDARVIADISEALLYIEHDVEAYCETSFYLEDATEIFFDGCGERTLMFHRFCRSIDVVKLYDVNGDVGYTYDATEVALQPTNPRRTDAERNNLYTWLTLTGVNAAFPMGVANVGVTGDWGPSTVPLQVRHAILWAVRHFFQERGDDAHVSLETGLGRTTETQDVGGYLPPVSRRLLSRWRIGTYV